MSEQVFKVFADCIPVSGTKRAAICDLGREKIYIVPKSLCDFIDQFEGKNLAELLETLDKEDSVILSEYLQYLEQHELIFWCDEEEAKRFPKIKPKWQSPSLISNVSIEFNPVFCYEQVLKDLNQLGCGHFQFRLADLNNETVERFSALLQLLHQSPDYLQDFEVFVPHQSQEVDKAFVDRLSQYLTLRSITFYAHERESQEVIHYFSIKCTASYLSSQPERSTVSSGSFFPNYDFFFESRLRNPYYNGKVCIAFNGDIKNSLENCTLFGKIQMDSLIEVARRSDFQKLWYAAKDQIEGCRDCEFRRVCFDTRPLRFDDKQGCYIPAYSCNYSPYTAQWEFEKCAKNHLEAT